MDTTPESETKNLPEATPVYWLEKFGMKARRRKLWSSNNLLSFFAFIISLGTFFTFTYQTYLIQNQTALIQKQQYASVLPYLTIYKHVGNEGEYGVVLENTGVGPAFIKDIKVHYDGKTYDGDARNFIIRYIYPKNPISTSSNGVIKGSVVPAGRSIMMVGSNDAKAAGVLRDLFEYNSVEVEITYTSVFDEVWKLSSAHTVPVKLDQ